jgi:hypothetical protein
MIFATPMIHVKRRAGWQGHSHGKLIHVKHADFSRLQLGN